MGFFIYCEGCKPEIFCYFFGPSCLVIREENRAGKTFEPSAAKERCMSKKSLSERDICSKYITPAIQKAKWDLISQVREEVSFTKGRIIVRGKLVTRGQAKRADYILYYKPNIPLALIEAKDNNQALGAGMQQALEYAETLDIPFVFSSNGDAFLFHDRTGQSGRTETELSLEAFPTPDNLWAKYRAWKGLAPEQEEIFLRDYFEDIGGKEPRYYQRIAINKAIEAILTVHCDKRGRLYTNYLVEEMGERSFDLVFGGRLLPGLSGTRG